MVGRLTAAPGVASASGGATTAAGTATAQEKAKGEYTRDSKGQPYKSGHNYLPELECGAWRAVYKNPEVRGQARDEPRTNRTTFVHISGAGRKQICIELGSPNRPRDKANGEIDFSAKVSKNAGPWRRGYRRLRFNRRPAISKSPSTTIWIASEYAICSCSRIRAVRVCSSSSS